MVDLTEGFVLEISPHIGERQFREKKLSASGRYFLFDRDAYRNTPYLHVVVPVLAATVGICFREAFLLSMHIINSNERCQRCLVGDFDIPIGFKTECEHVIIPCCLTGKV